MSYLQFSSLLPEPRRPRPTYVAVLGFLRAELLQDVAGYAYVEGDVMHVEDEHERHQCIDITQEGNVERVTRVLDLAHAEAKEMLYPYTEEKFTEDVGLDDTYKEAEKYEVQLTLPEYISKTKVELLLQLIHEYLVDRVMEDWMSITNAKAQEHWAEKCEQVRLKIKGLMTVSAKYVHRRMRPFG